ncbi:MAG: glycosyltransferase family 39 protein [Anaerolineales bacterium]|nr:glycosyltransferase family 39 protein [Anaerolineales bacterium]
MTRARWALLAILLLAAALRFYRAGEMSLRADEAVNILLALKEPGEIIRTFIADDPHQPLYYLILHFWMRVAGTTELAARFPTIFAGVVLVALVYVLGQQLFPRHSAIALVAAALAAINPALIWDAQDVYMYALLAPTLLVSFIAFLRALRPDAARPDWLIYVIASAAGLHLHYFAAFAFAAQGAVWLLFVVTRQISARKASAWLIASGAISLLFLPWLVVAFSMLTSFKTDFLIAASVPEMLLRALNVFTIGRTDARLLPTVVDPQVGNVLSLGFLVVFVYGLGASTSRDDWRARATLFVYLIGALIAIFLFSIWRFPIFDERYILFLTPAFALILACGLAIARARWQWISILMFAFVGLASANSLYNYFYVPAFAKSPDWRGFVQQIVAAAQPGDVVLQNYPDPALPYYLQERVPRVLLPRSGSATISEINADLQRVTNKYTRVWLQAASYSTWDTDGLVETWLRRHARLVSASEPRGLRLALYLPASVALRQAEPIDAAFAGQICLRAFDSDAHEKTTRPGATLRVTLYWQAITRPARAATVFVHLYDADGKLWSQQDNAPVNGTYPTTDWQTDVVIVDEYALTIPADAPSGEYFAQVGMYDSQTRERLSVIDSRGNAFSKNRVPLFEVAW